MAIKIGDKTPSVSVWQMLESVETQINTDDLFKGKKVALFALPGAFTPTCSAAHLPGYVVKSDDLFAKGIDSIVCLSVNDAFVMDAWGKQHSVDDRVQMIGDGNCEFTKAVGLEQDFSAKGRGMRSQRYAMVINDGVVEMLNVEEPGKFEVSDAETMLKSL